MGTRLRSAWPSARGAGAERAVAPGELRRGERRGVGRLWLIVGVGVALVKADVLVAVLQHRAEVIAVLGLGLAFSVLRPQPVGIAVVAAAMLAFTLAPSSTLLGIALGLGGVRAAAGSVYRDWVAASCEAGSGSLTRLDHANSQA